MRIALIWLLIWSLCTSASAQVTGLISSPGRNGAAAAVMVNTSGSGLTIPSSFIGVSVEVADLINGYYQGTNGTWPSNSSASSFVSLIQLLGSNGVFRFGGASSDTATPPALTQNIANNAQTFLAGVGSGWVSNVIYGLDLFANNSTTAANQAGFLATAFGASHMTFQFSNEPLSSGHFGSIGAYQTAWNAYYTAVTGAVASANYAAWDDTDLQDASTIIGGLTPGLSGLASVSYHRYGVGTTAAAVISYVNQWNFFVSTNASYLGSSVSKQRFTETNTLGNRGVVGLSDTLMAATFILTESIQLANYGYAGLNVHNVYAGGFGTYNPFIQNADGNFSPGTIFYGMYLFSQIEGQQILPSSVAGNGNIVAIATLRTASKANILIVNDDVYNSVPVTVNQSAAWSTATVLQLKGNSACGEKSPTLGGQVIGESGVWSGTTTTISNGQAVTLGPCEAALIKVQ